MPRSMGLITYLGVGMLVSRSLGLNRFQNLKSTVLAQSSNYREGNDE